MILEVSAVAKSYNQGTETLPILKGISLSIANPESVAIMGRSGCGKSTFISLLAGLDQPTEGTIQVLNQSLAKLTGRDLNQFRAQHIGIIFQQFHLLEHLTAIENVRLPLDLNNQSQSAERAEEILAKVGLAHRRNHFPDQLSRGECQRVAIARVLVMKPELVLADEPTGSLDVKTGREIVDLIFGLVATENIALVMATHDPSVAQRANRLFYMDSGILTSSRPEGFY